MKFTTHYTSNYIHFTHGSKEFPLKLTKKKKSKRGKRACSICRIRRVLRAHTFLPPRALPFRLFCRSRERARTHEKTSILGLGLTPNLDTVHPKSKMGVNSLPSESSNDLNEQIAQLMECKPLSEQQVPLYFLKKNQ